MFYQCLGTLNVPINTGNGERGETYIILQVQVHALVKLCKVFKTKKGMVFHFTLVCRLTCAPNFNNSFTTSISPFALELMRAEFPFYIVYRYTHIS